MPGKYCRSESCLLLLFLAVMHPIDDSRRQNRSHGHGGLCLLERVHNRQVARSPNHQFNIRAVSSVAVSVILSPFISAPSRPSVQRGHEWRPISRAGPIHSQCGVACDRPLQQRKISKTVLQRDVAQSHYPEGLSVVARLGTFDGKAASPKEGFTVIAVGQRSDLSAVLAHDFKTVISCWLCHSCSAQLQPRSRNCGAVHSPHVM